MFDDQQFIHFAGSDLTEPAEAIAKRIKNSKNPSWRKRIKEI